tara:strand:- start:51345 stop:52343 length:999 start_codon:yes stop_codon:yes gene_type:complete
MILVIYGTRPEYLKVKPLITEMEKRGIPHKVLFTGQHKDIAPTDSTSLVCEMVNYEGNRLNSVIKNCLSIPEEYFEGVDYILVQGDTTSVLGLALNALNRKIKVIHLEAGLRTYDTNNPYPEENNRKIVSTLASVHLCPTKKNEENLIREFTSGIIEVVGNTILDTLVDYKKDCSYENKVLITMHRRENHNDMEEWFSTINRLARENPSYEFILPLHPNPNVQKHKDLLTHINVVDPMSHKELIQILIKCKLVITDSGGIQEECSFFNKKCLVCRKITERPESVGESSFMVTYPHNLEGLFTNHINDFILDIESPYGDGKASEKICNILEDL